MVKPLPEVEKHLVKVTWKDGELLCWGMPRHNPMRSFADYDVMTEDQIKVLNQWTIITKTT